MSTRSLLCLAVTLTVVALSACSPVRLHAQRATEAQDAKLASDCRLAAQAITTGRPEPLFDWAMGFVSRCEISAGPALAAAWQRLPTDSASFDQLFAASSRVRDQRIFEALFTVANAPTNGWWARATAIRVMAWYVRPGLNLVPDDIRFRADSAEEFSVSDHWVQSDGAVPLEANSSTRVRDLLVALSAGDPDPQVRHTAAYVEKRLRLHLPQ